MTILHWKNVFLSMKKHRAVFDAAAALLLRSTQPSGVASSNPPCSVGSGVDTRDDLNCGSNPG